MHKNQRPKTKNQDCGFAAINNRFCVLRKSSLIGLWSLVFGLCACAPYATPDRSEWSARLRGASYETMTSSAMLAKRPVYLGGGGKELATTTDVYVHDYAVRLEQELYDSLLIAGVSVQRAGSEVVVLLTRNSFMYSDAPEISPAGGDVLEIVAKILNKYPETYIEIAGYADQMSDQSAAAALTRDMAQRAALFLAARDVLPVRMFIVGRGSARPIAAQDRLGRAMNRRVEIRLTPVK